MMLFFTILVFTIGFLLGAAVVGYMWQRDLSESAKSLKKISDELRRTGRS